MSDVQTAFIHSVETLGTVDGPGIRYVVFFAGCPLRCIYCHNPDTQDISGGTETEIDTLVRDIKQYKNFIRSGGVTLSGGEPLLQPQAALALLQKLKEAGIHTALDTAGSIDLQLSAPVLDAADLILLDIKALDDALCRTLTAQGPENTLHTLDYLNRTGRPVWLRHVLVPGYTLDTAQLTCLAAFLTRFDCIEKVELLPFHKMGEQKWRKLGRPYTLYDTAEPTPEEIAAAKQIFQSYGLPV